MMRAVLRLPRELGPLGIAALALIAAAAAFQALVLGPMAASNAALEEPVRRQAAPAERAPGDAGAAEKIAAVYAFLRKDEQTTDWLAKLHAIGTATGLQMKSATYRTQQTEGRIVRYEMVLPVAGSWGLAAGAEVSGGVGLHVRSYVVPANVIDETRAVLPVSWA